MAKLLNVIALAGAVACSSKSGTTTIIDAPHDGGGSGVDAAPPVDVAPTVDAPPDAPPMHDFACAGNTTQPTVPDPVTVTGSAGTLNTDVSGLISGSFIVPYTGNVDMCSGEPCSGSDLLGSATANSAGQFSFSLATGSNALPGYVEIAPSGSGSATTLLTLAYVGTPFVKNTDVPAIVLAPQEAIDLASMGGAACTTGSGDGFIAYKAVDCDGNVITDSSNVHGALTQGSDHHSVGDPPIDIYQTIIAALDTEVGSGYDSYAAPLKGIFLVCGVPAGNTALAVTYSGSGSDVAFLPVDVLSIGSAATEVAAQPGY